MFHSVIYYLCHVIVGKKVENRFLFAARADQLFPAQDLKLMGYRRLGHAQKSRDLVNAELRFEQGIEYLYRVVSPNTL